MLDGQFSGSNLDTQDAKRVVGPIVVKVFTREVVRRIKNDKQVLVGSCRLSWCTFVRCSAAFCFDSFGRNYPTNSEWDLRIDSLKLSTSGPESISRERSCRTEDRHSHDGNKQLLCSCMRNGLRSGDRQHNAAE
jgi:hypothetical protein